MGPPTDATSTWLDSIRSASSIRCHGTLPLDEIRVLPDRTDHGRRAISSNAEDVAIAPPIGHAPRMFERFTVRAREVVVSAQVEAIALGATGIGTEHLLVGLLRDDSGLARQVLADMDIDVEKVRARIAPERLEEVARELRDRRPRTCASATRLPSGRPNDGRKRSVLIAQTLATSRASARCPVGMSLARPFRTLGESPNGQAEPGEAR